MKTGNVRGEHSPSALHHVRTSCHHSPFHKKHVNYAGPAVSLLNDDSCVCSLYLHVQVIAELRAFLWFRRRVPVPDDGILPCSTMTPQTMYMCLDPTQLVCLFPSPDFVPRGLEGRATIFLP